MTNRTKLIALILASATGCSVALQARPTEQPCSTSKKWWIADAVITAAGVAAFGYGVARTASSGNDDTASMSAGIGGVGAVVFGASMGNGIRWGRQCRAQQGETMAAR